MSMRGVLVAAIAAAMVATATAHGPSADGSRAARRELRLGFWQVRDVQMRLARMGYPVGEVDGTLGPRTRTALRGFQQHRGFRPSGRLDPQTLAALDVATSSATSGASR
jgi:peptidoglycan hydrolase-like protein with peptidoglycan-binding domain